jgi:hypothetical protein
MKEALMSSETSVLTRATRRNIPEYTILLSWGIVQDIHLWKPLPCNDSQAVTLDTALSLSVFISIYTYISLCVYIVCQWVQQVQWQTPFIVTPASDNFTCVVARRCHVWAQCCQFLVRVSWPANLLQNAPWWRCYCVDFYAHAFSLIRISSLMKATHSDAT